MGTALAALVGVACATPGNGEEGDTAAGSGSAEDGPTGGGDGSTSTDPPGTGPMGECAAPLGETVLPCEGDAPYDFDGDSLGGWAQCGAGLVHRVEPGACALPPGSCNEGTEDSGDSGGSGSSSDGGALGCASDADCTDAPHGRCNYGFFECECQYGCESDADCAADQACYCQGSYSACIPADCHSDADCEAGQACRLDNSDPSCGPSAGRLTCTTLADSCGNGAGCETGEICIKLDEDACGFRCADDPFGCADAGRPFVVDGTARVAPCVEGESWHAPTPVDRDAIAALPGKVRRTIAQTWTSSALAEHASIASFSRFILDLLAVAAPPALVRDAHRALADEVEHAAVGLAIASAYAGRPIDPGQLAIAHATDGRHELVGVAIAAIAEGCVGETLAAAEVAEAARWAGPELAPTLAKIAEDELRHAALAWRFVRWALQRADPGQRRRIEAALLAAIDDERASLRPVAPDPHAAALRRHGVLPLADRIATRTAALREVVLPCARGLLACEGWTTSPPLS